MNTSPTSPLHIRIAYTIFAGDSHIVYPQVLAPAITDRNLGRQFMQNGGPIQVTDPGCARTVDLEIVDGDVFKLTVRYRGGAADEVYVSEGSPENIVLANRLVINPILLLHFCSLLGALSQIAYTINGPKRDRIHWKKKGACEFNLCGSVMATLKLDGARASICTHDTSLPTSHWIAGNETQKLFNVLGDFQGSMSWIIPQFLLVAPHASTTHAH